MGDDVHHDHKQLGERAHFAALILNSSFERLFETVEEEGSGAYIVVSVVFVIELDLLFGHELFYFHRSVFGMFRNDEEHLFGIKWIPQVSNCVHSVFNQMLLQIVLKPAEITRLFVKFFIFFSRACDPFGIFLIAYSSNLECPEVFLRGVVIQSGPVRLRLAANPNDKLVTSRSWLVRFENALRWCWWSCSCTHTGRLRFTNQLWWIVCFVFSSSLVCSNNSLLVTLVHRSFLFVGGRTATGWKGG